MERGHGHGVDARQMWYHAVREVHLRVSHPRRCSDARGPDALRVGLVFPIRSAARGGQSSMGTPPHTRPGMPDGVLQGGGGGIAGCPVRRLGRPSRRHGVVSGINRGRLRSESHQTCIS